MCHLDSLYIKFKQHFPSNVQAKCEFGFRKSSRFRNYFKSNIIRCSNNFVKFPHFPSPLLKWSKLANGNIAYTTLSLCLSIHINFPNSSRMCVCVSSHSSIHIIVRKCMWILCINEMAPYLTILHSNRNQVRLLTKLCMQITYFVLFWWHVHYSSLRILSIFWANIFNDMK